MGASGGERKKQAVLGSMASNSQTASSPELVASQLVSELLQLDDRPRSWSACSDRSVDSQGTNAPRTPRNSATLPATIRREGVARSLRPASILSSTRSSIGTVGGIGSDVTECLTTGSQPSIATTFSSDSHHVEARGKIYSQLKSEHGLTKSNTFHTASKPTLAMMKPLTALSKSEGKRGSVSAGDNNQSDDTTTGTEEDDAGSTMSKKSSRRTRRETLPAAVVAPVSVESSSLRPDEDKKHADKRPRSMYMWPSFSRFSSSGPPSDSDVAGSAGDKRKSAMEHLKPVETKLDHAEQAEQADQNTHNSNSEDIAHDDSVDESSEAKVELKKADEGKWAWGWFGGQSSSKPSSKAGAIAPLSNPVLPSTDQVVGSKPGTPEQRPALKDHNTDQKDNVLLPDLLFNEAILNHKSSDANEPDTTDCESNDSEQSAEPSLKKSIARPLEHDPEQPIYKRLRTMGLAAIGSAIEMAPSWARSMLYGQSSADALGQLGSDDGFGSRTGQAAESIKESIDRGAKSLGRVAIIGIHGWFPMRMVQMLAGEPTGKSEKFCLMMREALQKYLLENHGVNIDDSQISLFPLVGEGKIDDRVELLLSQLIDATDPDTSGQAAMPKDADAASSSNSRASSMEASTAASVADYTKMKPKPKTSAASTTATSTTAADINNTASNKHSEIMAKILMPERSRRVDALKEADTVFVVTHSQGTPVSAIILERLIEMEIIDMTRQRVALLAMAGISHGPLPYLKDNVVIKYIESEATRELFELMDPSSPQSQRYVAALSTILHKGVRLVCIGSWVDEVVPLYSAILQGVSHQNVYRAVYIDARHYLDDFLTNLIVFALRLRNMGIYDHDLLIHLSEVVAGSLWGHSGHSTVYAEPSVYKLAIRWLLYSTSPVATAAHVSTSVPTAYLRPGTAEGRFHGKCANVSGPRIHMSYRPFNATEKLNPFFIPWIMRTLWDEPDIRQNEDLRTELRRLVRLFDQWAPDTKVGRELKYRLEPVRAAM
ncbi:hypothetical protein EV175_002197 [Coemansia sp. RSA 1933]|nr:hypothetical protein EV175_002197 [Coemansia sp. RSA 1933]